MDHARLSGFIHTTIQAKVEPHGRAVFTGRARILKRDVWMDPFYGNRYSRAADCIYKNYCHIVARATQRPIYQLVIVFHVMLRSWLAHTEIMEALCFRMLIWIGHFSRKRSLYDLLKIRMLLFCTSEIWWLKKSSFVHYDKVRNHDSYRYIRQMGSAYVYPSHFNLTRSYIQMLVYASPHYDQHCFTWQRSSSFSHRGHPNY